ncbi:hypothetical protein U9M48_014088 [Paspalum notatum var. saurae]|uniref:Uncharacterized protein n=1 Tax=Paspalum notatum var. saurae TaxID=547442 RepID=A0AAQ3T0V1_PASNO
MCGGCCRRQRGGAVLAVLALAVAAAVAFLEGTARLRGGGVAARVHQVGRRRRPVPGFDVLRRRRGGGARRRRRGGGGAGGPGRPRRGRQGRAGPRDRRSQAPPAPGLRRPPAAPGVRRAGRLRPRFVAPPLLHTPRRRPRRYNIARRRRR